MISRVVRRFRNGAVTVVISTAALVASATNYVDPVGGNDATAEPGSDTLKYKTIQTAIDHCPAGGTVSLADATYDITSAVVLTNGITLVGSDYKRCIIRQTSNGNGNKGRVIDMSGASTIRGVTVTGGSHRGACNVKNGYGTGVLAGTDSTISYCCISNNYCTGGSAGGTGVRIESGSIDHTVITENMLVPSKGNSSTGAGVWVTGATTIDTCLIVKNGTAVCDGSNSGGAIYCGGAVTLLNSTIAENSAAAGGVGGVYIGSKSSIVRNCIFYDNISGEVASDWSMPDFVKASVSPASSGNVFSPETSTFGTPARAGSPDFVDAAAGNYRLAKTSPAINFGTWYADIPVDMDGVERGEEPDSGCYERVVRGVVVVGDPEEYGVPSPDYGEHEDLVDGETYVFRCPGAVTNGCVAYVCSGWQLTNKSDPEASGSGNEKSLTFVKSKAPYKLTWVWETRFVAKNAAYVSPGGRGTRDGYTPENAMESLSDAIELASAENPFGVGGTVHVAAGTYVCDVTLPLEPGVRIIGAGGGQTILDGVSGGIECFSSSSDVAGGGIENLVLTNFSVGVSFTVNTGAFAVNGCRFTDGRSGINASSGTESTLAISNSVFTRLCTTTGRSSGVTVAKRLRLLCVGSSFIANQTPRTLKTNAHLASTCFTYGENTGESTAVLSNCLFACNESFNGCSGAIYANAAARFFGCTFVSNRVTMVDDEYASSTMRSPCVVSANGNARFYDTYFGYNTLTNTLTAADPRVAAVLNYDQAACSFLFLNCTLENNSVYSTGSVGKMCTIFAGWNKRLGIVNCVFNGNDLLNAPSLGRVGEILIDNRVVAGTVSIVNSVFAHSASDYSFRNDDSAQDISKWFVVNSDIKGYSVVPGYSANVSDSGAPGLETRVRQNGDGRMARGVSVASRFRKSGEPVYMGNNAFPYLYRASGWGKGRTNPWLPVMAHDATITDDTASTLGLYPGNSPVADAFGKVPAKQRISYGPLCAPIPGLVILFR